MSKGIVLLVGDEVRTGHVDSGQKRFGSLESWILAFSELSEMKIELEEVDQKTCIND